MGVFVAYFGEKSGIHTYRVNGTREALYTVIDECRKEDIKFVDIPNLLPLRKGEWTMLLKIRVPVGMSQTKEGA